jgi:hypothetical protein
VVRWFATRHWTTHYADLHLPSRPRQRSLSCPFRRFDTTPLTRTGLPRALLHILKLCHFGGIKVACDPTTCARKNGKGHQPHRVLRERHSPPPPSLTVVYGDLSTFFRRLGEPLRGKRRRPIGQADVAPHDLGLVVPREDAAASRSILLKNSSGNDWHVGREG